MRYLLFMMCLVPLGFAQEQPQRGWYLGAEIGRSDLSDLLPRDVDADDEDTLFGLFGGYQFNKYFALEAGLVDFGGSSFSGLGESSDAEADGFRFQAVGMLPLHKRVALQGKLGWLHSRTEELFQSDSARIERDQSNDGVASEAGLTFRLTGHLNLSVSYAVYTVEWISGIAFNENNEFEFFSEEVEAVKAAVSYRF